MDKQTQRLEAKYHTWHVATSLPVSGCKQCKVHQEMKQRGPFTEMDQSQIASGTPRYDPTGRYPRKELYMDSNGALYWDPPPPVYPPEF